MDIPTTDPSYTEELKKISVGLYRWDEETGEVTAIFEAPREKCEGFNYVEGEWAYYNTMYNNKARRRCDNYRINIETREIEFICENATLYYLGGGYALHKVDSVEGFRLMNLKTGEFLPAEASGVSLPATNIYDQYFFLMNFSEKIEDSMMVTEVTYCMILHDSLADGLQEVDLIPVRLVQSKTEPVTPPTEPSTNPTDPNEPKDSGLFDDANWGRFRIYLTQCPQPPEEKMEKKNQYLPNTVENPDNLPVLKWVFALTEMDRTWTENAVVELNQMLADKKMPFRVQFAILMSKNTGEPVYRPGNGIVIPYNNYALLATKEAKELLKDPSFVPLPFYSR